MSRALMPRTLRVAARFLVSVALASAVGEGDGTVPNAPASAAPADGHQLHAMVGLFIVEHFLTRHVH